MHQEWGTRGQATKKPPLPLEGMNPQVNQPYNQNSFSKLANWDYGIDNTERWYAKTALDWHYAAGGLHPMDYNNRLSAIMVATMWSHLVAVFADLPAKVKCIIAHHDFIKQLNPQQREFLHAAEQVREIRFHSRRQQQLNNING